MLTNINVPDSPTTRCRKITGIKSVHQWEDKKAHFEVIVGKSMAEDGTEPLLRVRPDV